MIREVPRIAGAVAAAIRFLRKPSGAAAGPVARPVPPAVPADPRPMIAPNVAFFVDADQWDERARGLGGTSNALFAGIAARLAGAIGRVAAAGRVTRSIPVSERTDTE